MMISKIYCFFLALLFSQNVFAQGEFITYWDLSQEGSAPAALSIGVQSSGSVSYSWETVWWQSYKASGSGTFSGTVLNISRLPQGASIKLTINPQNFNGFSINQGVDRERLTDITRWGTTQWTSMNGAFDGCENLDITATDIPDVSRVNNMSLAFSGTRIAQIPNIDLWDVSKVRNMYRMFYLSRIFNSPIGNWNVSSVVNMSQMFYFAASFNQPINSWNVSNVTNMALMFSYATDFNQPIGSWNVANVTSLSQMFYNAKTFNQPIGSWNTGKVTTLNNMFAGAASFNQPIGNWNISKVTSIEAMFNGAEAFNQPLEDWDISGVTTLNSTFFGAASFNQSLTKWDVSRINDMGYLFYYASEFDQPIGNWDVGNVTKMNNMFYESPVFNQDISGWDVSKVTNMANMFSGASAFNQNLSGWDVSKVVTMKQMFFYARAFNQSLASWNLASVTSMAEMFSQTRMDCENTTYTIQGWAANPSTPNSITFGAGAAPYGTQGLPALNTLRSEKNWTVTIGPEVECVALAVSLIHFDAALRNGQVQLKWATANETDNDYFEIERSENALNWQVVIRINGAGTVTSAHNYSVIDPDPLAGTSYYRLKYVDFSGIAGYSRIRAINTSRPAKHDLYPNPATTSITISGKPEGHLKMYNLSGLEVMQTEIKAEKQQISVGQLPAGTYIIKMDDGWNTKYIKR